MSLNIRCVSDPRRDNSQAEHIATFAGQLFALLIDTLVTHVERFS